MIVTLLWLCCQCRDWDNLTAVIAAASAGHLDMVKFLVDSGADINAKDKVRRINFILLSRGF